MRTSVAALCCLLFGLSSVQEGSERLMVGDWEPADRYLVGEHSLWQPAVDRIIREIASDRPIVVSPENDSHESAWVRDYGPIAVTEAGHVRWLDTEYFKARVNDDALPTSLGVSLGIQVDRLPLRLEGGAVSSDGRGLCVMTEKGRDALPPGERVIRQLGCPILVLVPALPAEPTGHVDQVVQFLSPDVAAVAELRGEGVSAADAARLDEAAGDLVRAARSAGRRLRIVRVPAFRDQAGRYFSYVNFVSLPDRLLVPDFTSVPDGIRAEAYESLSAGSSKSLVRVPADEIALSGGGLHCIVLGLHLRPKNPSPWRSS